MSQSEKKQKDENNNFVENVEILPLLMIGPNAFSFTQLRLKLKSYSCFSLQNFSQINQVYRLLSLRLEVAVIVYLSTKGELRSFLKHHLKDCLRHQNSVFLYLYVSFNNQQLENELSKSKLFTLIPFGTTVDEQFDMLSNSFKQIDKELGFKYNFKDRLIIADVEVDQTKDFEFSDENKDTDMENEELTYFDKQGQKSIGANKSFKNNTLIFKDDRKKNPNNILIGLEQKNSSKLSLKIEKTDSKDNAFKFDSSKEKSSLIVDRKNIENKNSRITKIPKINLGEHFEKVTSKEIVCNLLKESKDYSYQIYNEKLNAKYEAKIKNWDYESEFLKFEFSDSDRKKIKSECEKGFEHFYASVGLPVGRIMFFMKSNELSEPCDFVFSKEHIFQVERRRHFRLLVFPDNPIFIKFQIKDSSDVFEFMAYDISAGGFSLKLHALSDQQILAQKILENVEIEFKHKTFKVKRIIKRHETKKFNGEDYVLVGYEFNQIKPKDVNTIDFFVFKNSIDYLKKFNEDF